MNFGKEFLEQLPRNSAPVHEFMAQLYEKTAEDGTLCLFAPYTLQDEVLSCHMDWDIHAFEKVAEDIYALHNALQAIAVHYDALRAEGADPASILQDATLLQVYHTYFVPLSTGDFDMAQIGDIEDRLDIYGRDAVSEEDCAYLEAFYAHLNSVAVRRVGEGYAPYNSYIGVQRLCRLYSLNAPKMVIANELNNFAAQFILHRHALSVERTALSSEEKSALYGEEMAF